MDICPQDRQWDSMDEKPKCPGSVKEANNYATNELQPSNSYMHASTLRLGTQCGNPPSAGLNDERQRKFHIAGVLNIPENLAELQVRRYKYPLTGNYYLDAPEIAGKSRIWTLELLRRFCKWKYLRWPLIFMTSVLIFFGIITYSMWLHDIGIARERYLQQKRSHLQNDSEELMTTESASLQESAVLRSLSSESGYRGNEQKQTTAKFAVSKGMNSWDRPADKDITKQPYERREDITTLRSVQELYGATKSLKYSQGQQAVSGNHIADDDERLLKLLNGHLPLNNMGTSTLSPDSLPKVSPTIPPVTPKSLVNANANVNPTMLDNRCYSTSLSMCQGVLDYDLTYNISSHIAANELADYQSLIGSNCSQRSVEFLCALLEPECRPSHIGVLPPCRRICKAILEACSEVIAASDILTAAFDCHIYPDSNDAQRCEDPTRKKDYCYDKEFACHDHSCIPQQWHCDNIKDCPEGEDEQDCIVCEQDDEFRCRSNEKCVPDTARCDTKFDCLDGSDEEDCGDYGISATTDEADLNSAPRLFAHASVVAPPSNSNDDNVYTFSMDGVIVNRSVAMPEEVANSVPGEGPKGFVNFRDSKEIMMTSDSENNFKISSSRRNDTDGGTTPLQPAASRYVAVSTELPTAGSCPVHQLRCVSGKCITVEQLCDRKIDCPDGFDELMCVYKDRTTTARTRGTTILPNPFHVTTSNGTRPDKRTIRTTIKRKVKP